MAASAADKTRMAPAWKLFDEGDKLGARKIAKAVLHSSPTEKERAEAEDLLTRTKTPGIAWIFAGVVIVAAIILTLFARSYLDK
ncbi:MAG: hypothetical protein ACJ790_12770 [Myxococcaceae bacterium]